MSGPRGYSALSARMGSMDAARRAGTTEAAIELRGGERVEWSRSPERRYDGARLTTAAGQTMELPADEGRTPRR